MPERDFERLPQRSDPAVWIRDLATRNPVVSVVIPIRQEAEHIEECVRAVLAQEVDATIEILVVDGMSTDRTREIVRAISTRDARVRLLDNPGRIVPTAMNVGIRETRGDIVVRVDGHCRIPRDYVASVLQAFRESGAECVGGAMVAEGNGYWGEAIAKATSSPFGMGGLRFHGHGPPRFLDTVYLGAYPKRVLLDLGLYDEEFVRNQDDELNYRLRARGGRVYFTSRIWAAYTCRSSLTKLARQYFQYGWWKVRLYAKHLKMLRARHILPSVFLLAVVVPPVVLPWFGPKALVFSAALVAVHAAAGFASAMLMGVRRTQLPGVVLAFLVLHISYGAGFLGALLTAPFRFAVPGGRGSVEERDAPPPRTERSEGVDEGVDDVRK